ncbi:MAG: hypothetical protein EBX50_22740, partial [Chitinophagia bacterium]|nr:hypothetical protein [Chitinophagia bacterium]
MLPGEAGSSINDLVQAARHVGFIVSVVRWRKPFKPFSVVPFIALVDYHFVVVISIEGDWARCVDPGYGIRDVPVEFFFKAGSPLVMAIAPNKAIRIFQEYRLERLPFNFKEYIVPVILISLLSLFIVGLKGIEPKLMQKIYSGGRDEYSFGLFLFVFFGVSFLSWLLAVLQMNYRKKSLFLIWERVINRLSSTAFFYQKRILGADIINRLGDVVEFHNQIYGAISGACITLLVASAYLIVLTTSFPRLVAALAIGVAFTLVYLTHFRKRMLAQAQKESHEIARASIRTEEFAAGFSSIVSLNAVEYVREILEFHNQQRWAESGKLVDLHARAGLVVQSIERFFLLFCAG